jgi:hypothetical protein
MLHIKPISESPALQEQFIRFGVDFPKKFPYILPKFYEKEAALLRPDKNFFFKTGTFKGWVACDGGRVVGRIAAMTNPGMQFEKGSAGLVGLYEAASDYAITRQLLDTAVAFLKKQGCTYIWGPMAFSIWHGYRFKTDCWEDPPFMGEPQNPPYYPDFFNKYGFGLSEQWESTIIGRDGMQQLCDSHKEQYELFRKLGYREETANSKKLIEKCWELVVETYKGFPGFSPLSCQELMSLYGDIPYLMERNGSFFFKDPHGDYVGFVLVLNNLARAVKAMNGRTDVLAKLRFKLNARNYDTAMLYQGGIRFSALRQAQRAGRQDCGTSLSLGMVTLYLALREMLKSGRAAYMLLPLMRSDAPNRNWAKEQSVKTMHYGMFELNL